MLVYLSQLLCLRSLSIIFISFIDDNILHPLAFVPVWMCLFLLLNHTFGICTSIEVWLSLKAELVNLRNWIYHWRQSLLGVKSPLLLLAMLNKGVLSFVVLVHALVQHISIGRYHELIRRTSRHIITSSTHWVHNDR